MTRAQASVLVLEDQLLIALDLEYLLRQAGFGDVTICASCYDAEQWLIIHKPELAVIETRLRDGSSDRIAGMLVRSRVPVIVHSADTRRSNALDGSPDYMIWVDKPYDPQIFLTALQNCFPA